MFSKTTPASSSVRSQHGVQRATNSPRIATLGDMKESQEDPPDSNSYFAGGHQRFALHRFHCIIIIYFFCYDFFLSF